MPIHSRLPVIGVGKAEERALALAAEFKLPVADAESKPALGLEVGPQEIRVTGGLPGENGKKVRPVRSDLSGLKVSPASVKRGGVPLYRAVLGRKRGSGRIVFDLTGGLGRDAWLLAAMGCALVVVEREGVIYALLRDGVARAGIEAQQVARRIQLIHARAEEVLRRMTDELQAGTRIFLPQPHVVYMDPFFHSHRKRKGASKRSLQVLRHLAGESGGQPAGKLVDLALQVAMERVVIKQSKLSDPLPSKYGRLSHSIRGRGCRFDVYQRTAG